MTKRFPGAVANDVVSFETLAGEVHALLGENGSGKTTLCNVLTGLYRPDEGRVLVGGEPVRLRSPKDAHGRGIFMVHQHLRLVESMSVAENVMLGWSSRQGLRFSRRAVERAVAAASERYQMPVDPAAKIWQLSLGERQRVEILKALYRGARVLILDEPTTVLTPQETEQLFESVRELTRSGSTVIFITHKLPEAFEISDRITVLRKGVAVETVHTSETTPSAIADMMVGREVGLGGVGRPPEVREGEAVLRVLDVSAEGDLGDEALHHVSLELHGGEILGIAGVSGNGQKELAEVVAGLRPVTAGRIEIGGARLDDGDPRSAIDLGVAYVPEDRMGTGIAPNLSIVENLMLKSYRTRDMSRGPVLATHKALHNAEELMSRFDIRAPGPGTLLRQLSGGNIQKVVLARELSSSPKLVVAASPTRGLDVGATEFVRKTLVEQAGRGAAVLLISEDLDEVMELSDRIAVFYGGQVAGVVKAAGADRLAIGELMTGAAT